jgi:glycosidase
MAWPDDGCAGVDADAWTVGAERLDLGKPVAGPRMVGWLHVGDADRGDFRDLRCAVSHPRGAEKSYEMMNRERPVIYQLMVRTFGNTNENRIVNGTLEENGCGKFADLTETALRSIKAMGFNHLWLTGVLEQASGTAYPKRPADEAVLLKGIAGSPYAIKDYFDVCPDYAVDPEQRLAEFRSLLARCEECGLRVIIDFVPNHVARSYASDIRPESSFGQGDDPKCFFQRDNHFYYLCADSPGGGAPLRLPVGEGSYAPEAQVGRVTGNNAVTWSPSVNDWYETVKLNYGHDFTQGRQTALPGPDAALSEVPKTWRTMDEILAYWQELGVGGFRADMAHMVPMEFWAWAVKRARSRQVDVFFSAEAYDNDPAKLTDGHVLDELLSAGFDAVYDDPSYDVLEGLYDSGKWANDLDAMTFSGVRFHQSLRYAENHDEVRLASPMEWGGLGMRVGRPVSAVLYTMGRGPVMLYHGQEVGEPAAGREGFGGDDARTTIFDYWSMPEFTKWVNSGKFDGGRLSKDQADLREWYGKLLRLTHEPAFTRGEFYGLNHANLDNPAYGRLGQETVSGHWLYSFLRHDSASGQTFLTVVNFHGYEALEDVKICIPQHAWAFIGRAAEETWIFRERLEGESYFLSENGSLHLPSLPPCCAMILEISAAG